MAHSGGSNTAEEEDASSSKQQGVLDVSDKKLLGPNELKRWRLFNAVLDGQGTPEDIQKDKPFQRLHNFVVYRGHSGQVMAWPEAKPTIKPYHGSKLRVEGELKRMASYKSGRKEEVSMRVVACVRRFAVDVRRGEQRGIWIEGKDVWFLLQAPRPDFAPLMRCYKTWYEKLVLAYDTYLVLEHLELQRLQREGRVGPSQVALSQLFNRTDLDLPPLTKTDGPEGIEEASYLFKIIHPATQTDEEADGADKKKGSKPLEGVVQFFNDYAKVRKGYRKGGGGASEDDASCMSEVSTNLAGASAQHEPISAGATRPSQGLAAAAGGDIEAEAQEGGRTNQGNVLTTGGPSLPVEAATGEKRKKVVVLKKEEEEEEQEKEEKEEEEDDDDDMHMQQILARVKAASPSTVPPSTAPPTSAAAATKKQKAAEKGGGGGGKRGMDGGYVIPKKKPKLADGALDEGRDGGGRGSGVGSIKGEGKLAESRPANSANDGARVFPPSSLPSSSAAPRSVPAPAVASVVPEAVSALPPSSVSSTGTCAPNELKQRLKVLKRPHAALAHVDVPFFLQAWGQIMGKDRQRVLEALVRSSDAVRAAFRWGGGLGGLVYWLHDQMSPRALGSQERKVLQGESGGAPGSSGGSAVEIFIQMLRLIQSLVDATANTWWDVEVEEWRSSQAGPVLADVEERLAPHTLDGIGGEQGKGAEGHGVWPHEAKVVATGVVHTIRAALAFAGRYPTPQDRARLATHPPEKPSIVVPPAHVGGGATGSQHPARASQGGKITSAGEGAVFGALAVVTESRRNRKGLRVSFKKDAELLQVHNYESLEVAADEQARRRAISLLDVKTANEFLEKGSTCFVS